ncbi:MAG: hypothetical protein K2I17_00020, partial [Clostridia bacterium]|nr:hypothetical protein [Clostridia bacterium]
MKKTRKALLAVLACSVALAGAVGLAACSGGDESEHDHAWGNWTVSTQPTDEATGKATRTCSGEGTCDAKATDKEYTLPALTSTDYTKGEDSATCAAAGTVTYTYNKNDVNVSFDVATAKKPHTEEVITGKAATCSEDGLTDGKKCTVCGETTVAQTTIAAHHTEITLTQKYPTCTEEGLTEGKKCTVCGEITVKQVKVDSLGHVESTLPAVAATCHEDGLTAGKKCAVCQTVLEAQTEVKATGHKLSTAAPTVNETAQTVSQRCTVCNKAIVYAYDNAVLNASGNTAAAASSLSTGVNYVSQSTANPYLSYTFEEAGTYTIYWVSLNNSNFNLSTATFGTTSAAFINSSKTLVKANIPEGFAIEGYCTADLQYYVDGESTIAHAGDYVRLTKDSLQSSQTQLGLGSFVPVKLTFTAAADAVLKFRTVAPTTGQSFLISINEESLNKKPDIVGEYCTIGEGNFTIKDTELEFMPVTEQDTYTFKAETGKFEVYVNGNLYSDGTKSCFGYVGFTDRYLTVTLQEGDVVKVVKVAGKASENTFTIHSGEVEEPAAPEYNTLEVGDNNITLSTTNVATGKYEDGTEQFFAFTAAESGYYAISVGEGVKVSVVMKADKTHYTVLFDVANMNKRSGVFHAVAGEAVVIAFTGNDTEGFTVNIASCEEPVTYLNVNEKLENIAFASFETIVKLTVGDSVAEGEYQLSFKASNSLLRSYIYFSVNEEIVVDDPYDSNGVGAYINTNLSTGGNNTVGGGTRSKGVDKADYTDEEYAAYVQYLDYTRTVTLKAGDVIYLATSATVSGYVDITLTPV